MLLQNSYNVYDLDVAGTYPTVKNIFNISKETTYRELSQIRDILTILEEVLVLIFRRNS